MKNDFSCVLIIGIGIGFLICYILTMIIVYAPAINDITTKPLANALCQERVGTDAVSWNINQELTCESQETYKYRFKLNEE